MDQWPNIISLSAFREAWPLEGEPLWRRVFECHRDKMQIKNPQVAIGNLEKIFTCTFRLANSKGFQAMSLRDLSRETGISMGGLYAYIGSKDDLASAIEEVLRKAIDDVLSDQAVLALDPVSRLKAIIFGDIYMNEVLHSWYYFCFLEAKGLSREQREAALRIELKFDERLAETIKSGIDAGKFETDQLALMVANTTSMLQQWYLKRWKFQLMQTNIDDYANFVLNTTLKCLNYKA
ncbi:MAG: TetR/AcrR family transcriptional regulator [Pseudohongiellaceae bacterium]|nr:TetR/AcrR family transcriptional regulator [Pseudohongiellaceae bacterium]